MQYFDLIFTLHAQDQLRNRGIKIEQAWKTFNRPDRTQKGKLGGLEFKREFDDYKISVVAIQNPKDKWVVKSVWRDPPLPGTNDERERYRWQEYRNAGFWGKIWIAIKRQLGI